MNTEKRAKEVLEEIVNPIKFMRERLQEGEQLNGNYAAMLAKDANYLQNIAKRGLDEIAGAAEAQDDWKRVEDGLPDYEEDVLVYGLPVQRSPQMGGNIPIWTKAKRVDLSGTSIPKRDWLRYQDKNQFRMMEEVYSWKRVDLPSPPSNDKP